MAGIVWILLGPPPPKHSILGVSDGGASVSFPTSETQRTSQNIKKNAVKDHHLAMTWLLHTWLTADVLTRRRPAKGQAS